jgi:hypothetical protein
MMFLTPSIIFSIEAMSAVRSTVTRVWRIGIGCMDMSTRQSSRVWGLVCSYTQEMAGHPSLIKSWFLIVMSVHHLDISFQEPTNERPSCSLMPGRYYKLHGSSIDREKCSVNKLLSTHSPSPRNESRHFVSVLNIGRQSLCQRFLLFRFCTFIKSILVIYSKGVNKIRSLPVSRWASF